MGPRRRQLGTAFAFVVTAAALAACGGGSAETVDAALVCDDIAVLDESIQALEDLVPATATEFVTADHVIGTLRLVAASRLNPVATVGQDIVVVPLPFFNMVKLGVATGTGVTSAHVNPTRSSSA